MQIADFEIQGQKLNATIKVMFPNLESNEISMNGTTVMKAVFNGQTGFQSQMGQKKEMTAEELAEKKEKKGLFEQLYYSGSKLDVVGTAKVGTADAYQVKITSASGKPATEYYNVKSGLLVKEEKATKTNGTEVIEVTEYNDYRKVGNILLPYIINKSIQTPQGNQEFVITVKEVKINTEFKAADFI